MCPVFLERCISSCLKSSEPPDISCVCICEVDRGDPEVIELMVLIPICTLQTISFML